MLANVPTSKEDFLALSYRDLKRRVGVDIKNWSEWFNGKANPTLDTLERLASDLEMPLPEFVEVFVERRRRTMEQKDKEQCLGK